jgi:flavin-dependent dehydrogenase
MRSFAGRVQERYRELALSMMPHLRHAQQMDQPVVCGPFQYRARQVADNGVFLVGDASGFSDPIVGEGLAAALLQAGALVQSITSPAPEVSYRDAHQRLTRNRHRVAAIVLHLTASPGRLHRGLRGIRKRPDAMQALLGVNLGYWGFNRVTPRQWAALLFGI